jgi:GTPase SAR1 family protein
MTSQNPLSQVLALYETVDPVCERYTPDALPPIRKMVASKKASPAATIMVYGVYNAGKSTLINALLGDEQAKVADIPETDRVQGYRWGDFEILDTPGIDAPKAHEAVTAEQLYAADIIIFVVNPLGVAEEEDTLLRLLDLVERQKRIFLVLNRKNQLAPEDAERIKDELRQRLQQMALAKGVTQQVLSYIPMVEVNAKSAFKAKRESKLNLLQNSGFPKFEHDLQAFFASVEQRQIIAAVATELLGVVEKSLVQIDERRNDAGAAQVDDFYAKIKRREVELSASLMALIQAKTAMIRSTVLSSLNLDPVNAEQKINTLVNTSHKFICDELEHELKRLALDGAELLDEMMEYTKVQGAAASPEIIVSVEEQPNKPQVPSASDIDLSLLEHGVRQASGLLKADHVVSMLKVGKDWLPTLFKGIGPVTMGKMAEQVVGKVLPVIGLAYQLGKGLYSALAGDPEQQHLEEQVRLEAQARERREQTLQSLANDVGWEFERTLTAAVKENIEGNFNAINEKLDGFRSVLGESEQVLSADRAQLVHCQAQLRDHV